MDSTSVHRPIELQAPEDFTYLINNVRRAAADSINAAFPPVEGHEDQEDELRVRIEQLVYSYIKQTFTLAAPSLTINGLPVSPETFLSGIGSSDDEPHGPEEHFEPFDGRKRQRVEELAREEEDLLREIAALKRKVPAAAAAQYAEQLRASVKADEEALEAARAKVVEATTSGKKEDGSSSSKKMLDIGLLERQEAVEEAYQGAVKALGKLKREMPATVAKMERARVAGEYIVTER